jgi:hypothetical protein
VNALWSYFWPAFGVGLIFGVLAGAIGFRMPRAASKLSEDTAVRPELRRRRVLALAAGALLSLAAAAMWHGPLGGADRFSTRVGRALRATLVYYEMTQVSARVHQDPLSRQVLLSGAADDFQRSELKRLIEQIPGVRSASWSSKNGGVPLIVEGFGVSLLGFLLGLLLAYLVELRRRYNAQWTW